MKKSSIAMLLTGIMCLGGTALANADEIILPAADAVFKEGEGLSLENTKEPTAYDAEHGYIVNLAQDGVITYTVPEMDEGNYDLYINVSKMMTQFTSQPFSFIINGGEEFSVPVDCQVSADAPAKFDKDGDECNTGSIYDQGCFPVAKDLELKSGDTIEVIAKFGAKSANLKGITYPFLGDLVLVPAGEVIPTGYDAVIPEAEETDPSDPLSGLNMIWLGSSVTYGAQARGHYSMVDAIQDNHANTVCEKYAISATTLVNESISSYVNRLKMIPKDRTPDLIVVQLSTNDATTGKEFGEIAEDFDMASFDDTTIAGAIETIIAYAKETFDCPVVFYSGSYCEKENYAEMVELLLQIQEKWGIGVIDLFNNEDMTAIYGSEQYESYMGDEVHPNRSGYVEWWTPVMEDYLSEYVTEMK